MRKTEIRSVPKNVQKTNSWKKVFFFEIFQFHFDHNFLTVQPIGLKFSGKLRLSILRILPKYELNRIKTRNFTYNLLRAPFCNFKTHLSPGFAGPTQKNIFQKKNSKFFFKIFLTKNIAGPLHSPNGIRQSPILDSFWPKWRKRWKLSKKRLEHFS